ncbi:uncharacterized protein LOC125457726 [Stegostoma tigrinum]|uniref:uncharacterized protein LOC125457726 n=1 Tax=Stegostoma tigrinum TaxID=3053191 RepID=UPI0028709BA1|nr:uncharacterized protein LOC125457726 [Stegostoma tigrinum]
MKVADINISGHKLMTNPTEPYKLDFENIFAQINEIFSPVTKKFELLKDHKASPIDKKKEINVPMDRQSEIKETERILARSEESRENSTETKEDQKESVASFESERDTDSKMSKSSQGETNPDVLVPPTIYHHIVQGNTAKVFWMVPEYDLVDSFDVQLQEMGYNNGPPPQVGVTFSGIDASSFETELKANSETIFRVRAITAFGQSDWSYPYKVSTKKF